MNTTIENDINIISDEQTTDEDILAFRELAIDYAAKELAGEWREHDSYPFGPFYNGAIQNAAEIGFFSINVPVEYGGVGMGADAVAAIVEPISITDASMAGIIFSTAAAQQIIAEASLDSNCNKIYEMISKETIPLLAFQSNVNPDETEFPVYNDETKTISGPVEYLVLGGLAKYAIIPAQWAGRNDYSYFLVNLDEMNVKKSDTIVSLGLHACPAVDILMERVPVQLIGQAHSGKTYFNLMQSKMSLAATAISLGIMKGSLAEALDYTNDRHQGGRAIINWGQVRMMMAQIALEVKIGECCLAQACQELNTARHGWEKTALATAIHTGEMASRATTDGVQLLGGNGYTKDYAQEKRMRDAKQVQSFLGMTPLKKILYIEKIIEERE